MCKPGLETRWSGARWTGKVIDNRHDRRNHRKKGCTCRRMKNDARLLEARELTRFTGRRRDSGRRLIDWVEPEERAKSDALGVLALILTLIVIFRPAFRWVIRQTPERMPVNNFYTSTILVLALAAGHLLDRMDLGVLLPIQVATSMIRVDLLVIVSRFSYLKYYIGLTCVLFVVKLSACLVPSLYSKMPLIDSVVLAFILSSKGIIELATYSVRKDNGLISEKNFTLFSVMVLPSSIIVPIFVKYLYDPSRKYAGYQARNIVSLKPESELRILACIHRTDNIASVIKLLDASHPTVESPINVYVLHLIKLIAQATPIFISHQKTGPISTSCSQNVILSFKKYEQDNPNAVSIHAFTSISSTKFMYEDIGTLALDKVTSLILLPLHRKWPIHGLIKCENHSLRTLNCRVLEKAPCSVGIFFERFKLNKENFKKHGPKRSHLSLCMIFLGGRDDREALILAKRMANNSNANLTVINFIADHDDDDTEFVSDEKVPDFTAIEKVQQISVIDESIPYKEQPVKDGPQTALHVHSIADDYDLFIMGRSYGVKSPQTSGLSEWSELPELGIIGDLLGSKDLDTEVSVLVVQQQRQMIYLD
ncbi:cation/H(+) antiporter 4-like [Hevea brasiliensis]|uniref:cation/H(+) antiporter 4-like n=1 Tax=Hevea brasiliensis TaxID=3981 RepID=UPI0025E5D876|nr:cation/H(+) antiporter 4-like [Hevea brasiliensis]